MKICRICKSPLIEGNPSNVYATEKGMNHISKHHFFPKRFREYFTDLEIKEIFRIENYSEIAELCYECHEEVLHNIVLNKEIVDGLAVLLSGKNKKARITLLHRIFSEGIKAYLQKGDDA